MSIQALKKLQLLSHEPMRITETHEHGPIKSDILKLREHMGKLNIRMQNEVDKPIGHIFQEELANFVNAMNRDMKKVAELFSQWIQKQSALLYRQRLKNVPTIPENLNDSN